ncbi:MAG: 30S ribosomal protein S4 [Minisyncoccia bacterium]|jgi:small subunit ribosomal protein S4
MLDPKCKKCRALGEKLFLKGDKCFSPKCPLLKRPYAPGKSPKSRPGKESEYGRQLNEKQKLKLSYGLRDKQLSNYFSAAFKSKTSTPEVVAQLLELRFDNIIFRSGLASSRSLARQLTTHGHFTLNGRRHDVPSARLKVGDVISINARSLKLPAFEKAADKLTENAKNNTWFEVDPKTLKITITAKPKLVDLNLPFDINTVVEYFSH